MKNIVITGNHPRHLAFAFLFSQLSLLDGLVIEEKLLAPKTEKQRAYLQEFSEIEKTYFPQSSQINLNKTPHLSCKKGDVNSQRVQDYLKERSPDNIFVFGSSLLKPATFEIAQEGTINLHTGLVQAFRGVDSSFWAIYEEKPEGIGSTIHFIDSSIDAGGLIAQGRPSLSQGDSLHDIFCKTILCGFSLIEHILSSKKALVNMKQKLSSWGDLYQMKDLNDEKIILTENKLADVLSKYLKDKCKRDAVLSINSWDI